MWRQGPFILHNGWDGDRQGLKQKRVRVGVIGVGHLGEYHVQKYRGIAAADLIGIVDSDSARAELIAKRYGTKAYSDHRDLLSRVDAVSLAVPTEKHYEVAKEVLAAGVHLLGEQAGGVSGAFEHVGRGLVDRDCASPRRWVRLLTRMQCQCG